MSGEISQIGCASLPLDSLAALGDLRRTEGISVTLAGDRAWVRWEPGNEAVLRKVLPLPGSELYSKRGIYWYRFGAKLPSFGLPVDQRGAESHPLHGVVVPRMVWPEPPGDTDVEPLPLTLVRDDRIRGASALRCPVSVLARWADSAPTARFTGLLAALVDDVVMVAGPSLPEVAGPRVEKFWGSRVLVPLGFRPEPLLPEQALRRALGIADDELAVLIATQSASVEAEVVPYAALRPLSRAGVRLADTGAGLRADQDEGGVDP